MIYEGSLFKLEITKSIASFRTNMTALRCSISENLILHKLKDNLCRSPLELVTLFWHDETNNSLNNDK